jgi:hypothetical protein
MSSPTLANVVALNGHTTSKPALVLVATQTTATGSRQRHPNAMSSILSSLGESFMSWQQVAVIAILVLGGCFLGAMGKETLAAMILGAAGGFISQPLLKPKSNTSDIEIVSRNP